MVRAGIHQQVNRGKSTQDEVDSPRMCHPHPGRYDYNYNYNYNYNYDHNHHHRLLMCAISTLNRSALLPLQHTAATPLKATIATPVGYIHGITIQLRSHCGSFRLPALQPTTTTSAAAYRRCTHCNSLSNVRPYCSTRGSTAHNRLLLPQHPVAQSSRLAPIVCRSIAPGWQHRSMAVVPQHGGSTAAGWQHRSLLRLHSPAAPVRSYHGLMQRSLSSAIPTVVRARLFHCSMRH
jgi:hypothetical protein